MVWIEEIIRFKQLTAKMKFQLSILLAAHAAEGKQLFRDALFALLIALNEH